MKCQICSHINTATARFCENCGQSLAQRCPNCHTPVSDTAKFCGNCGFNLAAVTDAVAAAAPPPAPLAALRHAVPMALVDKIIAERSRVEGERKLVTVLFADIVGSTSLAEPMDPEDWGEIVSGAHRRLAEAIYRYEGTIAQLLGDGVLAFFGAPLAHEDDAERAVRASLAILTSIQDYAEELRRAHKVPAFQMRVGLNTGLVVAGHIGSDLHMEYLAVGDTVNLAARMQSAAEPDTVLISENTQRLVAPLFHLVDVGQITVKGRSEQTHAYRVVAERRGSVRTRGIVGLDSPLVGREHELATLLARSQALHQGEGHTVTITGEAGLGKSRLIAELRKALAASGFLSSADMAAALDGHHERIAWLEGRSRSFEVGVPYAPFIDLFGRLFGSSTDASHLDVASVGTWLTTWIPDQAAEIAPFIAALLSIELTGDARERVRYLEPPQLRERIFGAVVTLVQELARRRPVVLLFDDLHWADATSLALLEQLLPLTRTVPLLILTLFRPGEHHPSWQFYQAAQRHDAARLTNLVLEPLDETHARTLVANLLHVEDLPEKVRSLILAKAEGNPFFVEEVIRSLLDSGLIVQVDDHWRATQAIEHITVPDTLTGVIAARLDRLGDASKRVAQTAAVIGREFDLEILAEVHDEPQVLDSALDDLQQRELVRVKEHLATVGYIFKHTLTQETAYASLLLRRRRELHRRVAECLERRRPDHVNDIARHYVEGQELARALPFLVTAADRAAHAYATTEAIALYTQAQQILQTVDNAGMMRRVFEGLGGALMMAYDVPRALETFYAMLAFGRAHEDIATQVSALNKLGMLEGQWMGDFAAAEIHLLEAEALARTFEIRAGLMELLTIRCGICNMTGDFGRTITYLGESVHLSRGLGIKEQMAFGLTHIATTLTHLGRYDEAWDRAQEALAVAREAGDQQHEAEALAYAVAMCHLRNGELDAAKACASAGVQIAAHIGAAFAESLGSYMLGWVAYLRGAYEEALLQYGRSLDRGRTSGMPFQEAMALSALGAVYLDLGPQWADKALELHAQTLALLEHPLGVQAGGTAWVDLGMCTLTLGHIDQAADYFQRGLTVPTFLGMQQKPRFHVGLALVALARGELETARLHVDDAQAFAAARSMQHLFPMIDLVAAQVSVACGDADAAQVRFDRAETGAREMGMRPVAWSACAGAADLFATTGQTSLARQKYRAACQVIDAIAADLQDDGLRAGFLRHATGRLHAAATLTQTAASPTRLTAPS